MQRGEDSKEDKKVKSPFQSVVMEKEKFEEDEDEIHCMEDKGSATFFMLGEYEQYLIQEKNSQEWDRGVFQQVGDQQRYNLRSNAKNSMENPAQRAVVQTEPQNNKKRRPATDPIILKALVQEVKSFDKSFSSFSFESKVQKLKIFVPLVELVKSEVFRKPILEALELENKQASTDSVNLQDDKPAIVLSPMIEPTDSNSPSFYVSLTIHDKILHNCLLDTGASHN